MFKTLDAFFNSKTKKMKKSTLVSRLYFCAPILPLFLAACHTPASPATTSLNDLVVENRQSSDSAIVRMLGLGGYVDQHEVLSIAGTLPFPETGDFYFYPDNQTDPCMAFGIAREAPKSYWNIGTLDDPTAAADVLDIKSALEIVQDKKLAAMSLLAQEVDLQNQIAAGNLSGADASALKQKLTAVDSLLDTANTELSTAVGNFRTASKKANVMIAQWSADDETGASGQALGLAQGSGKVSSKKFGFVILGGIRFESLVIAQDFVTFYLNIKDNQKYEFKHKLFPQAGLTTYVLQAKDVAFLAESDFATALSASIDVHIKALPKIEALLANNDEVKLSTYLAISTQLGNSAVLGPIEWTRVPFDFNADETNLPAQDDGWMTVLSVITQAPKVYAMMDKFSNEQK